MPIKNFGATPTSYAKYIIQSKSKEGVALSSYQGEIGSIAPRATHVVEFNNAQWESGSAIIVEMRIPYGTVGDAECTNVCIRSGVSETGKVFSTAKLVNNGQKIS